MLVSVLTVRLYAEWVSSLKEKRTVVKSLCAKLKNSFNASVCESDKQDVHCTIVISIAYLADSNAAADSIQEKILDFVERTTDAKLVEWRKVRY